MSLELSIVKLMAKEKLKVVELFAGVGGFRIGLERAKNYEVVWSNQYEPSTKTQHASDVYVNRFGEEKHSNEDIEKVIGCSLKVDKNENRLLEWSDLS